MQHIPHLFLDLALILATAAVASLIFRSLKQPIVLGYLLAGFFVGPNMHLFPTITDGKGVQLWAELGVVFLLFALGLEFSFKKVATVGARSGIVTAFEVLGMSIGGYFVGRALGWSQFDSIFLGGIVSISSTSIILRIVDEMGFKNKKYISHVFGGLIFEDIAAVLLLVMLTTLAVSQKFAGVEMLTSLFKLIFFLSIWFIAGVFLLPGFIRRTQKYFTDEIGLVLGVGFCLLMAVFAGAVGLSVALGAFIAGSLLSETAEGERIHHVVGPVRDLFSAVFFVSVGMLIDPVVIVANWQAILAVSLFVVIGKIIFISIGAIFVGHSVRTSVMMGLTMAQIGEFSFIIATLGLSLGVISKSLYPLAVSVSVLTSFLTPVLIRHGEYIADQVVRVLPEKWISTMDAYSVFSVRVSVQDEIQQILRRYFIRIVANATVIIGLFLLSSKVILPWLLERQVEEGTAKIFAILIELILSSPFLWAISFGKIEGLDQALAALGTEGRQAPTRIFIVSRVMISAVLLTLMIAQFVSGIWAVVITAWILVTVGYTLNKQMGKLYQSVEQRFLTNLGGVNKKRGKDSQYSALAPWDAHIVEFQIEPEWAFAGSELQELAIRERFGVSITMIERGKIVIAAPGAQKTLLPGDKIHVVGTEVQLAQFQEFLQIHSEVDTVATDASSYSLEAILLGDDCQYVGKSIRDSGLRDRVQGMLVGLERDGNRILNPHSDEVFRGGDLLWLVGDKSLIKELRVEAQGRLLSEVAAVNT